MKTPNDVVQGTITNIDEHGNVTITAHYDDWYTLTKRQYKKCNIQMIDNRPLSDKQRKACYALIGEIADYTGDSKERMKDLLKIQFLADELQNTADSIFSLANAPMSLVCAFQRYLVDFIVGNDIPCRFPLLDYVDDISGYMYSCLINKKCCVFSYSDCIIRIFVILNWYCMFSRISSDTGGCRFQYTILWNLKQLKNAETTGICNR